MSDDAEVMTLERLERLLDAYGPAPEGWPAGVRGAAERLIVASPAARALHERAADLERILLALPPEAPSAALRARVLAAAPRRRPAVIRWRYVVAAVPLAAAAVLALWVVTRREPATRGGQLETVAVGEYGSPTDVLLQTYGVDVYAAVPSIGCADASVGCPGTKAADEPTSRVWSGRLLA